MVTKFRAKSIVHIVLQQREHPVSLIEPGKRMEVPERTPDLETHICCGRKQLPFTQNEFTNQPEESSRGVAGDHEGGLDEQTFQRSLSQNSLDGLRGGAIPVGIRHPDQSAPEVRISGALQSGFDRYSIGGYVDDVACSLAALLAYAHIDDRQSERRGLHDAARRVADHCVRAAEEAPVRHGVEIDEHVSPGPRGCERSRPPDERKGAGIGVGVDEDQLPIESAESREQGIRFGVGVGENRHRMPCDYHGRRRMRNAKPGLERAPVQQLRAAQVIE